MSKKTFVVEGVDVEKVKATVEEIRTAVNQAKENLAQNNLEEAGESLQVIHEGGFHPGEMMGVLNRLSEITRRLKKIKSEEIKNDIKEVLSPVYEAVNIGDFREANMLLNEIERELWKIMDAVKSKSTINTDMRSRMEKLEQKLQQKIQQEEKQPSINAKQQSYYDYRNYSASLFDKIMFFFGL